MQIHNSCHQQLKMHYEPGQWNYQKSLAKLYTQVSV